MPLETSIPAPPSGRPLSWTKSTSVASRMTSLELIASLPRTVFGRMSAADQSIELDSEGHELGDAGRGADRHLLLLAWLEADAPALVGLGVELEDDGCSCDFLLGEGADTGGPEGDGDGARRGERLGLFCKCLLAKGYEGGWRGGRILPVLQKLTPVNQRFPARGRKRPNSHLLPQVSGIKLTALKTDAKPMVFGIK